MRFSQLFNQGLRSNFKLQSNFSVFCDQFHYQFTISFQCFLQISSFIQQQPIHTILFQILLLLLQSLILCILNEQKLSSTTTTTNKQAQIAFHLTIFSSFLSIASSSFQLMDDHYHHHQ